MSEPLNERWLVSETQEDDAVVFVERVTSNGETYAHVLFEADWGELEHAEHIAKLHNDWLEQHKAELAPTPPRA